MSQRAEKNIPPPSWKTPHGILLGIVLPLLLITSLLVRQPDDFEGPQLLVALSAATGVILCLLQMWVSQGDLARINKDGDLLKILLIIVAFIARLMISVAGGWILLTHLNQLGSSGATTAVIDIRSVRTSSKGNNTMARLDPAAFKQEASAVVEANVKKPLRDQLRHGSKLKVTFRQGSLGWPWGTVDEVVQGR